jgi:hypothetical protein
MEFVVVLRGGGVVDPGRETPGPTELNVGVRGRGASATIVPEPWRLGPSPASTASAGPPRWDADSESG